MAKPTVRKAKSNRISLTPADRSEAKRHFEEGLHIARKRPLDRMLLLYHFSQAVRYDPKMTKAWPAYLLCMFAPAILLRWYLKRLN